MSLCPSRCPDSGDHTSRSSMRWYGKNMPKRGV
jgi:hypothetical protein